jgi:outer membrane protein assembly factor BamB
MPRTVLTRSTLSVLILSFASLAAADDWPQWRGPKRDGRSAETGLLSEWPEGGLKWAWKSEDAGLGYSAVSVADGRVYLQGHHPNLTRSGFGEEKTIALDEESGRTLWMSHAPQGPWRYARGRRGKGGRSTPTVDGEVLYTLDPGGALAAFEAETGRIRWSRHAVDDLQAHKVPDWDFSESPLIDGDRIFISTGSTHGSVVALDKHNGQVLWRSEDLEDGASYSSPIIAEIGGARQLVLFTDIRLVGLSAEDGKLLWYYTGSANNHANVATPIAVGGKIFSASDYGAGGALIEPKKDGKDWEVKELWFNRLLTSPHDGAVLVDGHFYGFGKCELVCVDLKTGETDWTHKTGGSGTLTYADGHLYCLTEKGELSLVEANPNEYVEKGRFTIPLTSRPTWAHPVVANGRLYVRNQNLLFAYDVTRDGRHTTNNEEAKKEEPKEEPKKAEPKKAEPKKAEPKKERPRQDDAKPARPKRRSTGAIPPAPPAVPTATAVPPPDEIIE